MSVELQERVGRIIAYIAQGLDGYELSDGQKAQLQEWVEERESAEEITCRSLLNRYKVKITPTGIGHHVEVEDLIGNEKLDLSDYGNW